MSLTKAVVLSALVAGLSACVSMGDTNDYQAEVDRLDADCRARGGILQPTGSPSANAGAAHVCVVP